MLEGSQTQRNKRMSEFLRTQIEASPLTLRELSLAIGMSKNYLSVYFTKPFSMKASIRQRILDVLADPPPPNKFRDRGKLMREAWQRKTPEERAHHSTMMRAGKAAIRKATAPVERAPVGIHKQRKRPYKRRTASWWSKLTPAEVSERMAKLQKLRQAKYSGANRAILSDKLAVVARNRWRLKKGHPEMTQQETMEFLNKRRVLRGEVPLDLTPPKAPTPEPKVNGREEPARLALAEGLESFVALCHTNASQPGAAGAIHSLAYAVLIGSHVLAEAGARLAEALNAQKKGG